MYLTWSERSLVFGWSKRRPGMISPAVKHREVRSSSSVEGRLQKQKTFRAELMWWVSPIWVIPEQLLQRASYGGWVGAAAQTSPRTSRFGHPAVLATCVADRWARGSLACSTRGRRKDKFPACVGRRWKWRWFLSSPASRCLVAVCYLTTTVMLNFGMGSPDV